MVLASVMQHPSHKAVVGQIYRALSEVAVNALNFLFEAEQTLLSKHEVEIERWKAENGAWTALVQR